jgi:Secretion system C-terminal sorting domain
MKKSISTLSLLLAALTLGLGLQAQSPARAFKSFQTDGVDVLYHNSADAFWDLEAYQAYEVPRGSGKHTFFASSFWMGGFDSGNQLHMAANTYRQSGEDFFAGPIAQANAYNGVGFDGATSTVATNLVAHSSGKLVAITRDSIIVHDPVTGTSTRHILPINPTRVESIELADGRIFVLGQGSLVTPQASYLFEIAFPSTGLTVNPLGAHNNSALVNLADGRLLIHGGVSNEILDPSSNTFSSFALAPVQQCFRTGVQLPNGTVMFFGGNPGCSAGSGGSFATYFYNLGTNTWSSGPNMARPHYRPSVVALPSGDYLVFGGNLNDSIIERYDPVANTFSSAGYLPLNAAANDAELLPDGRVFVVIRDGAGTFRGYYYQPTTQAVEEVGFTLGGVHAELMPSNDLYIEFDAHKFRRMDIAAGYPSGMRFQKIWSLTRAEIDQFRSDFAASTVNFANYPDIASWPGNGNTSLGESAQLAPYIDINSDGLYRPDIDGDYPCIAGDQAIWWMYNDNGPHTETSGLPLGVQVAAMVYAIDCDLSPCPDTNFRYQTFAHLDILNRSENDYHDTQLGLWTDVDLGNWTDDFIGCDTSLGLGFCYNGDNDDETTKPSGYGVAPPAAGILLLPNADLTKLNSFMTYENDFSAMGNPSAAQEYYNYLNATWKDGQHLVNNGLNGWPTTASGPAANHVFPGDPGCGNPAGWNEITAGNVPFDRRMVLGFGPFDLPAGGRKQFDYSVLYARGTDHINSLCQLKSTAQSTLNWWNGFDRGCFGITVGVEDSPIALNDWRIYPNPASNQAQIVWTTATLGDTDVQLLDMTGRTVRTWRVAAGQTSLTCQLDGLAYGMYLVSTRSAEGQSARKLMVQQ